MRITAIMGSSLGRLLKNATDEANVELVYFQNRTLADFPEKIPEAITAMKKGDVALLYLHSESFWEQIKPDLKEVGKTVHLITVGDDPSYWAFSSVDPQIIRTCQKYFMYGGGENFKNLLSYLKKSLFHEDISVTAPIEIPFQGIYHPDSPTHFTDTPAYLTWYSQTHPNGPVVGLLFSRLSWTSKNTAIEDALIRSLEQQGMNVIAAFSYGVRDDSVGSIGIAGVIRHFFLDGDRSRVDALVKLIMTPVGPLSEPEFNDRGIFSGVDLYKKLNIPIFHPIISTYLTLTQWEESPGLKNDVAWGVAMPEFEGEIEPIFIGARSSEASAELSSHPVHDRCEKIAKRVKNWIALAKKPVHERKVAFILNNSPCASVEANVGAASHLDSLESVARILQEMAAAGYSVTPPENGKVLIDTIMERKAISEFRWTTVQDIVAKGGTLALMDMDTYLPYFKSLPPSVQEKVLKTWGEPPGLGMILDEKLLITGVQYGNATISVQPKRGCYGARCDGEVCKILHDPECSPPHQYLATYYYLREIFGADVLVDVGTHGNLEFLPGKGVGLSQDCFPDIAIGTIPHLYIYNADNPPEGTIAKRRSYATLVDHMQTVLTQGGLYEELEEIENLLNQYETAKNDPARAHALQHMLLDAIGAAHLDKDMHLSHDTPLAEMTAKAHETLSKIRNTQIQKGMHIFGEVPEGEKRLDFINSIIRFDSGELSPRRIIAAVVGLDLSELLTNQDKYSDEHEASNGALLERLENITKHFIWAVLNEPDVQYETIFSCKISPEQIDNLDVVRDRIRDINRRIDDSKEIDSLLHGFNGKYIPAGPSGLISRGHEEVLPTGRNFYSLDPFRVPTRAASRVGQRLADALIAKHVKDEGTVPENVAFYWMAGDIMSADGEMYAELLWLLGTEPVWQANGQVKSFTIVPLEKLGRPRIDITVRTSGILRDNFSNCYELVDEAVQAVAALDEPPEQNFVRKHAQKMMVEEGTSLRDATLRIFSSRPRTYGNGVNLAVLASAWKTEADLADIFVAWNGYAYGKDIQGKFAHEQLAASLSTVSVTFNKVQSDEYDLLGCCCYFGTHGGITAAARHYSGNEVKPYYGDTREPENIEVRDLADELRRVVRTKLLNPKWIEGMKEHGYKGASDMMKRITRVYGWEASTQEVDDWIFDDIAETFVNDEEMRKFFEDNNPYALEEIARRLLEAHQRGLWDADEQVLENLKNNYLEIESWMEDQVTEGDYQGESVDIITSDEISAWGAPMKDLLAKVHEKYPRNS
jgi:cobaltochelatase CobN